MGNAMRFFLAIILIVTAFVGMAVWGMNQRIEGREEGRLQSIVDREDFLDAMQKGYDIRIDGWIFRPTPSAMVILVERGR
jgi:hypothetical protein